ncbi:MAG TPA: hypothetical protein VF970_12350 [Gemmatimonadales bacterium]
MSLRNERGVALPVTIFIVTLLTITLAAAFARVDAERAIAVGTSDAVNALQVAQGGVRRYMASLGAPPPDGDSVRFNVIGGYADVRAWMVRRPANPMANQTYVVRSTGYAIEPMAGATPQGVRTVAQFGYWQTPRMRRLAAFTAANGLRSQPPTGGIRISGNDQCGLAAGISSVKRGVGGPPTLGGGGSYTPSPDSPVSPRSALADATGILWAAMVGGGLIPDHDYLRTGYGDWHTNMVQGDATLSNASGTGLLVVTGNLTTAGDSAFWNGIVLVGGELIFGSAHTRFQGILVTGLDLQLSGPNPNIGEIGGTGGSLYEIEYSSCYVDSALTRMAGFVAVPNAWVDNWPSY